MIILIAENSFNDFLRLRIIIKDLDLAQDCDVHRAENSAQALALAQRLGPDLVFLDLALDERDAPESGVGLLPKLKDLPKPPFVVVCTVVKRNDVLDGLRRCDGFLVKPVTKESVGRVLKDLPAAKWAPEQVEADSPVSLPPDVEQDVWSATLVDFPLLITGETGTGKTTLARRVHDQSTRAGGPFKVVNCGVLPTGDLAHSELFGHAKGAFTGAATERKGKFEDADGGTVFIDEAGLLSVDLQAKLLRVLDKGEFERMGENKTRSVNVRVIAATSVDLEKAVAEGTFRPDLFFRLRVIRLHMPPLRQKLSRLDSLLPLALGKIEKKDGRRCDVSPEAMLRLKSYGWPGNIRELENVLEEAFARAKGRMSPRPSQAPAVPRGRLESEDRAPGFRAARLTPAPGGRLMILPEDIAETTIPPLRQRPDDLEWVAPHFISEMAHDYEIQGPCSLKPSVFAILKRHGWPGDARELYKVLKSAFHLAAADAGDAEDAHVEIRPQHIRLDGDARDPLGGPADEAFARAAPAEDLPAEDLEGPDEAGPGDLDLAAGQRWHKGTHLYNDLDWNYRMAARSQLLALMNLGHTRPQIEAIMDISRATYFRVQSPDWQWRPQGPPDPQQVQARHPAPETRAARRKTQR